MRIISQRRGFDADHSSSTYEFFALRKLTPEQRATVQQLTDESPRRHLSFHYVGDWQDIPSDWPDKLLVSGYDVMVSESYDWWTVRLVLPHDPDLLACLELYQCESDGNGIDVAAVDERLLLSFGMQLDYNAVYGEFGQDVFEGLADLFKDVRDELLAGDMSAAWAMYQAYGGYEDDEEPDPVEPLSASARTLLNIMENY